MIILMLFLETGFWETLSSAFYDYLLCEVKQCFCFYAKLLMDILWGQDGR